MLEIVLLANPKMKAGMLEVRMVWIFREIKIVKSPRQRASFGLFIRGKERRRPAPMRWRMPKIT